LVYVAVSDYAILERQVVALENKLRLKTFHWAETGWKIKRKFMDEALAFDFKIKVAVINNPIKPDKILLHIMEHLIIERNIKQVVIDGKKPKWYGRVIKKALRDKGVSVRKLRLLPDVQSPGIRIADMAAGMIRSYADQKNRQKLTPYFERLKKKIIIKVEE